MSSRSDFDNKADSFKIKHSNPLSKAKAKTLKPILNRKVPELSQKVFFKGEDVTPLPMMVTSGGKTQSGIELKTYQTHHRSKTGSQFRLSDSGGFSSMRLISESVSTFYTELRKQGIEAGSSIMPTTMTYESLIEEIIMKQIELPAMVTTGGDDSEKKVEEEADNELLSAIIHGTHGEVSTVTITLYETSTEYVFEMPSKTVELNTPEGKVVERDNDRYDYLTTGKGRNRKMVNQETQTMERLLKKQNTDSEMAGLVQNERKVSKRTCTWPITKKHNFSYVSYYEMYDTYQELAEKEKEEQIEKGQTVQVGNKYGGADESRAGGGGGKGNVSVENNLSNLMEKEVKKISENERFFEAVCVIERLLANNNFNYEQKRYKGIIKPDPFRETIEYKYRLNHLWTYANEKTNGQCVSCGIHNPANDDLFVVGFGKFYFTDICKGMVMIWNIKNPVQPERAYNFDVPVTCLQFSTLNPNILAIGFYDGKILVVDCSFRKLMITAETGEDSPSHLPVWQLMWFPTKDSGQDQEMVMGSFHDGRICMYANIGSKYLKCTQIMRLSKPEGKQKGLQSLRQCRPKGLQCNQFIPAMVVRRHPRNKYHYYVGSTEGTIHRCSTHYFQHYMDVFKGHDGSISQMISSPFCNKIYLTCGDDWYCRIWAEDIIEPLIELTKEMETCEDVAWSPTHSTIIASLTGNDVYIWDLQRKTYYPQSIHQTPSSSRNTIVTFTKNGECLLVGDIDGNVHVFSLEDMPFPAFYNDALLTFSLKKALYTNPELLKRLEKLGNLNFDTTKSGRYFE